MFSYYSNLTADQNRMRNEQVITFGKYFNEQFSYAVNAPIKSFRKYQIETPSVSIIKQCVQIDNV